MTAPEQRQITRAEYFLSMLSAVSDLLLWLAAIYFIACGIRDSDWKLYQKEMFGGFCLALWFMMSRSHVQ